MPLPQPDLLSQTHSDKVRAHLRQVILDAGGRISFARYMHEALYARGLGYYAAGTMKFGAAGDFVTAPEVSSVFGQVLARQAAEVLEQVGDGVLLEFGAGSGKLAVDLLIALDRLGALPDEYRILEVSPDLQQRQQQRLRAEVPQLASRVSWLADLPATTRGVVIANEVLDAMPVERFVCRDGTIRQLDVAIEGDSFTWVEGEPSPRLAAVVHEIEQDIGMPFADGYVSEVSLAVPQWIGALSDTLAQGAAFLFDYGVARREYYAPDRGDGWLRCHFRHHAHDDPFLFPGIQDLTSWVDFSAVAAAAVDRGMDVLGYQPQSHFLIGGGLDDIMAGFNDLPTSQQLELSGQIKTLTLPGEMGENFKCMVLGRGEIDPPSAFHFADRTETL